VFCQNHDISWQVRGEPVTPTRLAQTMLELQARGCHNINWVTPEHVDPQILEAVPLAIAGGFGYPRLVGSHGRDGYREIDRHLYREEYLRAIEIAASRGCGWTPAASPAPGASSRPAPRYSAARAMPSPWPA
jgi:uncharacterized Fe-S radical SAM superfamily protein PflX